MAAVPAGAPRRLAWRIAEVVETRPETPRTKSIALGVPDWKGHRAGQHVDVRLTAALWRSIAISGTTPEPPPTSKSGPPS